MKTEQTEKQKLSKSTLYGYRKPTVDEYGRVWCNCTQPTLVSSWNGVGQAYCLRCSSSWYN